MYSSYDWPESFVVSDNKLINVPIKKHFSFSLTAYYFRIDKNGLAVFQINEKVGPYFKYLALRTVWNQRIINYLIRLYLNK